MSKQLPISINGTDFSNLFEYTARSESLRRVQGKNAGVAKNGEDIYDDLAIKYDLRTTTVPARPNTIRTLMNALTASTVSVRYFSFLRNQYVTQTMRVENLEAVLGLLKDMGNDPILNNVTIVFRQK